MKMDFGFPIVDLRLKLPRQFLPTSPTGNGKRTEGNSIFGTAYHAPGRTQRRMNRDMNRQAHQELKKFFLCGLRGLRGS
jgi:hypothetical protein